MSLRRRWAVTSRCDAVTSLNLLRILLAAHSRGVVVDVCPDSVVVRACYNCTIQADTCYAVHSNPLTSFCSFAFIQC